MDVAVAAALAVALAETVAVVVAVAIAGTVALVGPSNNIFIKYTIRHRCPDPTSTAMMEKVTEKQLKSIPNCMDNEYKIIKNSGLGSPRGSWDRSWHHVGSQGCPKHEKDTKRAFGLSSSGAKLGAFWNNFPF